jgi:hypothetical protein
MSLKGPSSRCIRLPQKNNSANEIMEVTMVVDMAVDMVVVIVEAGVVFEIWFRTAFLLARGSLPTEPLKPYGSAGRGAFAEGVLFTD